MEIYLGILNWILQRGARELPDTRLEMNLLFSLKVKKEKIHPGSTSSIESIECTSSIESIECTSSIESIASIECTSSIESIASIELNQLQ
ncbi:hypothetical protein O181_014860 [Austropuccinia psidii MF-1]|uniref:Uncharacterized protein n=1 Tax=Austropuccinia psidii MF-1 TaxID=1389203 RepID=A0A9Q3C1R9_9BASI|nr:hypothetical protein [Austropuccinia psidii MF-1]